MKLIHIKVWVFSLMLFFIKKILILSTFLFLLAFPVLVLANEPEYETIKVGDSFSGLEITESGQVAMSKEVILDGYVFSHGVDPISELLVVNLYEKLYFGGCETFCYQHLVSKKSGRIQQIYAPLKWFSGNPIAVSDNGHYVLFQEVLENSILVTVLDSNSGEFLGHRYIESTSIAFAEISRAGYVSIVQNNGSIEGEAIEFLTGDASYYEVIQEDLSEDTDTQGVENDVKSLDAVDGQEESISPIKFVLMLVIVGVTGCVYRTKISKLLRFF
jgi:hypothetical protein